MATKKERRAFCEDVLEGLTQAVAAEVGEILTEDEVNQVCDVIVKALSS